MDVEKLGSIIMKTGLVFIAVNNVPIDMDVDAMASKHIFFASVSHPSILVDWGPHGLGGHLSA